MTEFRIEVIQIGKVEKHPNADSLSITHVHGGYPVIFRTGDYNEGDLAVYVPVDSVVPSNDPRWSFLGDHHARIRAKRLRGVFSMGLLTPSDPSWTLGQDVVKELNITKYKPPEDMSGENERDPGTMSVYDIEGLRRYPQLFQDGQEVWISEKIHGANARYLHDGERLWVGSRTCIKKQDSKNMWWRVAERYELEKKLATIPNIALYGEVYGQVQDLKYGKTTSELILFDALNIKTRQFLDVDYFLKLAQDLNLPVVPTLYRGPWSENLKELAEGKTQIPGANHVREGIVIKPIRERQDPTIGRVFLKLHGQGFLLRK